jgi:drug/metabolite transporter (DMT)-like permease
VTAAPAFLAILATICFALAATLWQRATMRAGFSAGDPGSFVRLARDPVWLLGLAAQGLGVVFQAAALDRGRVAIIQPLLVVTIIWALPLGYFLTGQKVTWTQVGGAVLIVAGLVLFGGFGDPAGGIDDAPTSDWVVAIAIIVVVCAVLGLLANRGSPTVKAGGLGAVAGILFGLAAVLMKPVVESWHVEGLDVLGDWQFWVMCIAGVVGFLIQQLSLATGRLVPSVATVSVANPIVSVALGALILEESLDRSPMWHAVLAVAGLGVALGGAVVISVAQERAAHPDASDQPEPEPVPG